MGGDAQFPTTPIAAERAISARLLTIAVDRIAGISDARALERARSETVQRLRRELAYRRFLARLFITQPDSWVLKGGVGLMFRLDPNRPSYDIDIAYIGVGVDHAAALRELKVALRTDLGDWFTFELGSPRTMADEAGAVTVSVVARIGAKEFARFSVDMPAPREEQFSSRSRDLADIAMIATQQPIDGSLLEAALAAEALRRASARLPEGLPTTFSLPASQLDQWKITWAKSARKAPIDIENALAIVERFLGPVLAARIDGMRWSQVQQAWTTVET